MRLSFVAVKTPQQFRDLLIIRNECRDGLTHYKREITLQEQVEWSKKCWPGEDKEEWYEPYLLYDDEWPIAYGLLKWDGEKYWMTIGVAKDNRNKGLSWVLTNLITEMGHREGKEVWLDVMEDNPALSSYIKAGYEFVTSAMDGYNTLLVMKHKREQNLQPKELFWLHNNDKTIDSHPDL